MRDKVFSLSISGRLIRCTVSNTRTQPLMVTKAEIDGIYDMEKVIEEDWEWQRRGPNLEGEATVYCLNEDVNLTLKAWKRRSYGFCLLYKSSKIVRRWDSSTPHTNPDGEVITEPHKHY